MYETKPNNQPNFQNPMSKAGWNSKFFFSKTADQLWGADNWLDIFLQAH